MHKRNFQRTTKMSLELAGVSLAASFCAWNERFHTIADVVHVVTSSYVWTREIYMWERHVQTTKYRNFISLKKNTLSILTLWSWRGDMSPIFQYHAHPINVAVTQMENPFTNQPIALQSYLWFLSKESSFKIKAFIKN